MKYIKWWFYWRVLLKLFEEEDLQMLRTTKIELYRLIQMTYSKYINEDEVENDVS